MGLTDISYHRVLSSRRALPMTLLPFSRYVCFALHGCNIHASCLHRTSKHVQAMGKTTTLKFEFYRDDKAAVSQHEGGAGHVIINIPHLDRFQESEHEILKQLVLRYQVPEKHRCAAACMATTMYTAANPNMGSSHAQPPA